MRIWSLYWSPYGNKMIQQSLTQPARMPWTKIIHAAFLVLSGAYPPCHLHHPPHPCPGSPKRKTHNMWIKHQLKWPSTNTCIPRLQVFLHHWNTRLFEIHRALLKGTLLKLKDAETRLQTICIIYIKLLTINKAIRQVPFESSQL